MALKRSTGFGLGTLFPKLATVTCFCWSVFIMFSLAIFVFSGLYAVISRYNRKGIFGLKKHKRQLSQIRHQHGYDIRQWFWRNTENKPYRLSFKSQNIVYTLHTLRKMFDCLFYLKPNQQIKAAWLFGWNRLKPLIWSRNFRGLLAWDCKKEKDRLHIVYKDQPPIRGEWFVILVSYENLRLLS